MDLLYTIGQTVTVAQAASIGSPLPDTATMPPGAPDPSPSPAIWPAFAAGLIAFGATLLAPRRRRATPRTRRAKQQS
jgi:hypothetical protein